MNNRLKALLQIVIWQPCTKDLTHCSFSCTTDKGIHMPRVCISRFREEKAAEENNKTVQVALFWNKTAY